MRPQAASAVIGQVPWPRPFLRTRRLIGMSYGGMLRRSFGVAVATVAFVAILVAAAAAGPVALLLGKSFTLVAGPQENLGVGASVLGADGTVWLAEPISQPRSFEIVARAANGRRLGPVIVSAQAGFENAEPTISVSGVPQRSPGSRAVTAPRPAMPSLSKPGVALRPAVSQRRLLRGGPPGTTRRDSRFWLNRKGERSSSSTRATRTDQK